MLRVSKPSVNTRVEMAQTELEPKLKLGKCIFHKQHNFHPVSCYLNSKKLFPILHNRYHNPERGFKLGSLSDNLLEFDHMLQTTWPPRLGLVTLLLHLNYLGIFLDSYLHTFFCLAPCRK